MLENAAIAVPLRGPQIHLYSGAQFKTVVATRRDIV